jgi:hypothetical protein
MSMKKHLTDEECLDFVRRLLPQAQSEFVQHHLNDGCEACNALHNIWNVVAEVTARKAHDEPTEESVRIAKAFYFDWRAKHILPALAQMMPLVFDNWLDKSAAAVRAQQIHAAARRLLHRTRTWVVDLKLENEGGGRTSIAGQVLRSDRKSGSAVVANIILTQGETLLAQTSTNQFGEFQLQSQRDRNLKLYLDVGGRRPLGIVLPDPDLN